MYCDASNGHVSNSESNMPDNIAIQIDGISKCYQIYQKPKHRLLQSIFGKYRKYYDEFWALSNISLQIRKGETVGIIGRNGSGKSTLLQLICGILTPTKGQIKINGRISALLELGAGFNPDFSGMENVFLNATILGLKRDEIESKLDSIVSFADIGDFIHQPVKTYSSGMYARLAFAMAINVEPEILIVDEILSVGDSAFQRKCMKKFYEIRDSGCTIIFVSHDEFQVRSICKKALYLKNGMQNAFSNANAVMEKYLAETELPTEEIDRENNVATNQVIKTKTAIDVRKMKSIIVKIVSVSMETYSETETNDIYSGDDILVRMRYRIRSADRTEKISFVVNLYRQNDFYVFGTTTIMDGFSAFPATNTGEVIIKFPSLKLLSGRYKWRVAVNDDQGIGILAEAVPVCHFNVSDRFEAVGLINLDREWIVNGKVIK